jgi:hypothetical protein
VSGESLGRRLDAGERSSQLVGGVGEEPAGLGFGAACLIGCEPGLPR